jgi:hypothetical protein
VELLHSGFGQGARHHVLAHAVELVGELAAPRRPRRREALVRRPAQEQGVGGHHLVELELVALGSPVELERPAAALEALGAARVLDHAIQSHELGDDHLAHVTLLSSFLRLKTGGGRETNRLYIGRSKIGPAVIAARR